MMSLMYFLSFTAFTSSGRLQQFVGGGRVERLIICSCMDGVRVLDDINGRGRKS